MHNNKNETSSGSKKETPDLVPFESNFPAHVLYYDSTEEAENSEFEEDEEQVRRKFAAALKLIEEAENKEEEENSDESVNIPELKTETQKAGKEILIIVGSTIFLAMIIYLILTVLGLASPSRPLVVSKGAAKPFFHGRQRKLIEDNFDGSLKISDNQSMSVILLYSPYSFKSKLFREEYYNVAKKMNKLHGTRAPYFTATNCFDSNSYCRKKYNLKQYPALMAQNCYFMGSIYNGPLTAVYVQRWLNRLHNPLLRLQSTDELIELAGKYDIVVILYYKIQYKPSTWPSANNFTKLAFHYLDGDPNTERTVFCTVTDSELAAQFQLHNEHDVVIVSSELKLLSTHHKGWELEKLYADVVYHAKESEKKGVQILNLGKSATSVQLAEKINSGSVFLYFSPKIVYGSKNFMMIRQTVKDYLTCPEKDILLLDASDQQADHTDDCSKSVKSHFCSTNSTLSFIVADSEVESELAIKLGGFKNEMIIAINARQEITRFVRKNVTKETINCLIRQHHNAADNEFVSESSKIMSRKKQRNDGNVYQDAIGDKSTVNVLENVTEILNSEKINVILFSGGVWHSASAAALAPFHVLKNYFRESATLISFSIVDVSQTYVPYNLNFEQLPKVLITSVDNIGVSWTYPEDFMINHTNIAQFVLSRPGKIFERLRRLNSCQGDCRKRVVWETRSKRSQLKRQLKRNVSNSTSQRVMIGHYNKLLRMMG